MWHDFIAPSHACRPEEWIAAAAAAAGLINSAGS